MQKIGLVFQIALRVFLIFLLFFVWIRFFVRSLLLTTLIALLCAAFVEIILNVIFQKHSKLKDLKISQKEECENMFLSLAYAKNEVDFFFNLASTRHKAIKKKKYVLISHEDHNVILYPHIKFSPLSKDDITEILNTLKNEKFNKLVICCGEIMKDVLPFVKNFEIECSILDKFETYKKIYEDYDFFPKVTTTYKKDKKTTFKEMLSYSFNKSKTKSYLLSALVLLFSSLFIRFNLYYSIMISLLVIFAIISFFNPFSKAQKDLKL